MITVDQLIAEAETWIGTPIAPVGAVKHEKCNCLGMAGGIARSLGLDNAYKAFAPYEGHGLPPKPTFLIRGLRQHLRRVSGEWKRGHLLLINNNNGRVDATHVALCTGPKSMIDPGGKKVHPAKITTSSHPNIGKSVRVIEWYEIPGVKYD
jgi:hypothetical protein